MIGTRLWFSDRADSSHYDYRSYDIRSGATGNPCTLDFPDYRGTDGAVTVRTPTGREEAAAGQPLAQAYDHTTCGVASML